MKSKTKKPQVTQKTLWQRLVKHRSYYLMLLPFMALIIVFHYFPMYGVTLAFKDFKVRRGILGSPWAGFKYFEQLFTALSFWEVLRNTIVISLLKLAFGFPAPIILALFINEIRNDRVKKTFQTFTYLPHFISWVIAASFVEDIIGLHGPINAIITKLGNSPIYFQADPNYFRGLLIVSNIWKGVGWGSIVYIAAITGIDQQMYEAAEIDGAKKLQQIWYITLPSIRSTILTIFILDVGKLLNAGFDQVYNLYSGAVFSVGDILDTYTYRQGLLDQNYSYSTAAGLFKNVVGFILVIITNWMSRKLTDGEEGLW